MHRLEEDVHERLVCALDHVSGFAGRSVILTFFFPRLVRASVCIAPRCSKQ